MRRWTSLSVALSAVVAWVPAVQAGPVAKGNASAGNASVSAPASLGRPGAAVGVDSSISLAAPSVAPGVLPQVSAPAYDFDAPGLKARAYAKEIQGRERAAAAAQFLQDDRTQDWLRANAPERHRDLFEKAAGLNDLRLILKTYDNPDTLRLALLARSDMTQANSPRKMLSWIDADPSLHPFRDRVAAAFWEWETLEEPQRWALNRRSVTPEQWAAVSFETRRRFLRGAGQEMIRGTGIGGMPKSETHLETQRRALLLGWGAFDNDERFEQNERFKKGATAFRKLKEAKEKLESSLSPTLRGVLDQAEKETDPDRALHWLKIVFDGVGDKTASRVVSRAAEPNADQRFTDQHRRALGLFMKRHLLQEIAGTQAGDMLLEFFRTQPLNLRIGPLKGSRYAQYEPKSNEIAMSEKIVLDYLRAKDMSLDALFQNGPALSDLIALLAPSFVHEATHQTQFQALVERGVPPGTEQWYDTTLEVEAFSRQTLYVHEKARTSERHRLLFIEGQRWISATRSDTQRAQTFKDDPERFRMEILGAYAEVSNLSGMAARRLRDRQGDLKGEREARRVIGAELALRSRLPRAERLRRENEGMDLRAWSEQGSTPVDRIKTSSLRASLRHRDPSRGWVYDAYRYLRDRYSTGLREIMTRLTELYPKG
ncbi:MAG: hypothetical protein CO113_15795 [Elusimicrobia bacterium CG_4_9_14_3_um_filter_62_55]|nr:MAG: hypothetical protein COX66_06825 [Elusimicrobia bacterium CG_4_10_14_0_2_um_filter_63_34]PJB24104.1 MAG: hypothetical protein CO113_15795 [Elusimicrobia bacterium CG_4_9_14_3_um_filter_62_55]